MEEVTVALLLNEMWKKSVGAESQADGLFVRGRTVGKGVEKKNRSRSKSKGNFRRFEIIARKKDTLSRIAANSKGRK